jgi:hypothetical protein
MADISIDYRSMRAQKARIGRRLNRTVAMLLWTSVVALSIAGAGLIFMKTPVGWTLIGLASFRTCLLCGASTNCTTFQQGKIIRQPVVFREIF